MSIQTDSEIVRNALHTLAGIIPDNRLEELAASGRKLSHANMQLGINAQIAVIDERAKLINQIVEDLTPYYLERTAEFLKTNIK